jgi:hypothetical protein
VAVLEVQLNTLADMEPVPLGITDESFDAIPTATFAAPRPDAEALSAMSVSELKRLIHAHRLSDVGCIEKAHLIDVLSSLPPPPPDAATHDASSPALAQPCTVSTPTNCAICMSDFRDGETLKCGQ